MICRLSAIVLLLSGCAHERLADETQSPPAESVKSPHAMEVETRVTSEDQSSPKAEIQEFAVFDIVIRSRLSCVSRNCPSEVPLWIRTNAWGPKEHMVGPGTQSAIVGATAQLTFTYGGDWSGPKAPDRLPHGSLFLEAAPPCTGSAEVNMNTANYVAGMWNMQLPELRVSCPDPKTE